MLGSITEYDRLIDEHIDAIINLNILPLQEIQKLDLFVIADTINSGGAVAIPKLLDKLKIRYKIINQEIKGKFNHTPEPLAENLKDLSKAIIENKADFGIAVDPDVDRLVFFDENGQILGEEYTQVFCSDFVLSNVKGNTVSTLSSSNALKDLTESYGLKYYSTPVGEMNVVKKMKEVNSIVGGEPIKSCTISLRTVESEIANSLTKVQNDNKDVEIGSYPFFHAGKLGVSIVIRSEDQNKIDHCNSQILKFVNSKKIAVVDR